MWWEIEGEDGDIKVIKDENWAQTSNCLFLGKNAEQMKDERNEDMNKRECKNIYERFGQMSESIFKMEDL